VTGWVWGHARCFVDDTINELLALSPGYVAALGVRCVLVWRRADGERVYTAARGDRPRGGWFDDLRDRLYLRTGEAVVEIDLATGESRERAPRADDPATAAVERDRSGTAATVTWPDGHVLEVSYPHELVAGISCAEEVVAVPHGVRAVDVLGRDGALRWTFKNYQRAVLSPDGREIALVGAASKRIVFADVATGVVEVPGVPSFNIEALELSPDGARLLVIAGGYAWLLDPATGRPVVKLEAVASPRLLGDSVIDASARFVAGGRFVVGAAGHRLVRWDAATGAVDRSFARDGRWRVHVVSFDADGVRVAVHGALYPGGLMFVPDQGVHVIDLERGCDVAVVEDEEFNCDDLVLAPDGRELAVIGETTRIVALPEAPGGAIAVREAPEFAGFRREGLRVRVDDEEGMVVERLAGGAVVGRHPRRGGLAFAAGPNGQTFAVGHGDGRIEVCDADGRELATLTAAGAVRALALGPRLVFAGGWDCTVHALEWRSGGD
jgi:hypothetical protein